VTDLDAFSVLKYRPRRELHHRSHRSNSDMRILILVDCYLPSTKSSAKLVHDLGAEYVQQGHEVLIACPDDTLDQKYTVTAEEGLEVLRVRTGQIKGAARWLRGINEARLSSVFWSSAREVFAARPCDLIIYYSPTIFFGGLVRRLKRLWNCPSYLVLRDIFPQWAVDAGVLRKGPAYLFFRWAEFRQYAAADVIGVQSPANLNYFHEQGLAERFRLDVLYNWTTLHEPAVPQTNYRDAWQLAEKTVFFYGGNIGVAQDMDNILRLAEGLRDERQVHFLLVGEGSEVPRLRQVIAQRNLQNVSLKPAVGQGEYLGMLAEFDVGLISLDKQLKTQNLPGKMLGYMYHSLPMLASINPGNDLGNLLEGHSAGLVSLNGDDARLRKNALKLARSPALRAELGQQGRQLLESTFAVENAARQILEQSGVATTAQRRAA